MNRHVYIYIMQLYSHSYLPYSFAVGCNAGWHDLVDASEEQQHWYNQPITRHRSSFCNIPVYTRYTAQKPHKTNTHSDDKTCRYKTDAHIFIVWLCVSDCVCLCVWFSHSHNISISVLQSPRNRRQRPIDLWVMIMYGFLLVYLIHTNTHSYASPYTLNSNWVIYGTNSRQVTVLLPCFLSFSWNNTHHRPASTLTSLMGFSSKNLHFWNLKSL